MEKLGITDASFLYFEQDGMLMNIASVQRFEKPAADSDMAAYFERFREHVAARVHGVGLLTRVLKRTPLELDQPVWTNDASFDIQRHVFRTRLPTPGTDRQLNNLVARLHEAPLDRTRPLWEMHLIDGLEDGTFAIYSKYHHAAVDGVSAQQILDLLYADAPDRDTPPAAPPQVQRSGSMQLLFDALVNLTLQPLEQMTRAGERLRALARLGERWEQAGEDAAMLSAPRTLFNDTVGEYRAIATTTLPLPEMRACGKQMGASLNDVLLAVCADGLRRYLLRKKALPGIPLLVGIPVSLRQPGDAGFNNKVSMLRASLATDLDDPLERLAAIVRSTRTGKRLLTETRALIPDDVHLPGLSTLLENAGVLARQLHLHELVAPMFNVLVSNVPGPRRTKYLLGAKMLTHHPISIVTDGNALNITVQSYGDRLDLGITACLDVVPDVERLRDDILAGWKSLKDAVGARAEATETIAAPPRPAEPGAKAA
jgi:WS/DGAT/MGAT family acyltransferase